MKVQIIDKPGRVIACHPIYGGPPVVFTLRGIKEWFGFLRWEMRYMLTWHDCRIRLYDADGKVVSET